MLRLSYSLMHRVLCSMCKCKANFIHLAMYMFPSYEQQKFGQDRTGFLISHPIPAAPTPSSRHLRGPTGPRPRQTTIVHDTVVRHHCNDAPAKPLMADAAHPLIADGHAPVLPALAAGGAVAEQEEGLAGDEPRPPQPGDDARVVDDAVGGAHPPPEVRFELGDGKRVRDEGKRRFRR